MVYLKTAVRLAGVNSFFTRRVLQRCQRGEITVLDAARLLIAASQDGATVEVTGVQR